MTFGISSAGKSAQGRLFSSFQMMRQLQQTASASFHLLSSNPFQHTTLSCRSACLNRSVVSMLPNSVTSHWDDMVVDIDDIFTES